MQNDITVPSISSYAAKLCYTKIIIMVAHESLFSTTSRSLHRPGMTCSDHDISVTSIGATLTQIDLIPSDESDEGQHAYGCRRIGAKGHQKQSL